MDESLESGEQNVTYIGFNHMIHFSPEILTGVISFTFKILKEEQTSGEARVRRGRNRAGQMLRVLQAVVMCHIINVRAGS